jgi:hypothetical protein
MANSVNYFKQKGTKLSQYSSDVHSRLCFAEDLRCWNKGQANSNVKQGLMAKGMPDKVTNLACHKG